VEVVFIRLREEIEPIYRDTDSSRLTILQMEQLRMKHPSPNTSNIYERLTGDTS